MGSKIIVSVKLVGCVAESVWWLLADLTVVLHLLVYEVDCHAKSLGHIVECETLIRLKKLCVS